MDKCYPAVEVYDTLAGEAGLDLQADAPHVALYHRMTNDVTSRHGP